MTIEEKMLEIKNTLRIHNELAQSQCQWLIDRVESLTTALEEIDDPKWSPTDSDLFAIKRCAFKALESDE